MEVEDSGLFVISAVAEGTAESKWCAGMKQCKES